MHDELSALRQPLRRPARDDSETVDAALTDAPARAVPAVPAFITERLAAWKASAIPASDSGHDAAAREACDADAAASA